MKKTLLYLGLILLFFIAGFWMGDYFINFSIHQISNNGLQVAARRMSSPFFVRTTFALAIAALPLLYLLFKTITKTHFLNRGFIASCLILGFGIIFWGLRIYQLNYYSKRLKNLDLQNDLIIQVDYENLNFQLYLFIGFFLGTLLSILFLNKKFG